MFWFLGLLNLRGMDIQNNPVFFAYIIVTENDIILYILNKDRINTDIEKHFESEDIQVKVHEYNLTLSGIEDVVRSVEHVFQIHFKFIILLCFCIINQYINFILS